jgi:coronatine-insensitive protein 1
MQSPVLPKQCNFDVVKLNVIFIRFVLMFLFSCGNKQVRDVIGDLGLGVVAQTCKKLQRLRVERGDDDNGALEDEQGIVSQAGVMAIAQGCPDLTYWAIHVSDITSAALEAIGTHCKNLNDFRLVLLEREANLTELPLDNGVRGLLRGCTKLRRFAFYVRPGVLSDIGLGYIGEFSKSMLHVARLCWPV